MLVKRPCWALLGRMVQAEKVFEKSTRIKRGARGRAPLGHKAPQCGAFSGCGPGTPLRPNARPKVVGETGTLTGAGDCAGHRRDFR